MAQILKQSTAVDVLIGPFLDLTDAATAETGESPSVKLSKNGQTLGAKNDATTPTHDADGYYNCELDATDTNTVGTLVLTVAASANALPVRHEFQVVEEATYDFLYANGATPIADINAEVDTALTDYDAVVPADLPSNFADLSITATTGRVDVATIEGTDATDQINAACDTAIETYGLDHLVSASVAGTDITDDSIVAKLVSSSATADWDDFVNTSDSLQAIRDHIGDGTNLTEAGGTGDHLTAITDDTGLLSAAHSEPTGVPAANETPLDKIGYLFMALRNKLTVTASKKQFFDDGGTAEWEKDLSDDGTTYTETEGNAP